MASVGELLSGAAARLRDAGSETPRLDAEVLLADILKTERTRLIAHPETPIADGVGERFEAAIDRRATGEPVAYIRGIKEFFGLAFATDSRALIPRPETERLVEADLLPPVLPDDGAPLDIVLANLPYVRSGAIDSLPVAASFEPRSALDGGADGLDVIRRLLALLPDVLASDGVALLEIGADQGSAAPEAVAGALPGWIASVETDLAGLPRILRVARGPE